MSPDPMVIGSCTRMSCRVPRSHSSRTMQSFCGSRQTPIRRTIWKWETVEFSSRVSYDSTADTTVHPPCIRTLTKRQGRSLGDEGIEIFVCDLAHYFGNASLVIV